MSTKTVTDELDSIARMLCAKHPDRSEGDVTTLVRGVYARLSSEATVMTHLIPLTMNRCQRILTAQRYSDNTGPKTLDSMTIAS